MRKKQLLALWLGTSLLLFQSLFAQHAPSLPDAQQSLVDQFLQEITTYQAANNYNEAARYLNKVARIYWDHEDTQQALDYYSQSLGLNQKLGNTHAQLSIYNFMGMIHADRGEAQRSIDMYQKALDIARSTGQRNASLIEALKNMAFSHESLQQYKTAIPHMKEALEIAQEMSNLELMRTCYFSLADLCGKAGLEAESVDYFAKYSDLDKHLFKEGADKEKAEAQREVQQIAANKRAVEAELQGATAALGKADSLNQEAQMEIRLLEGEKEIRELKLKEQEILLENERLVRNSLIGGFVLVGLLAFALVLGYLEKRKSNRQLAAEKEKSENLLLNILPKATADELKNQGFATPRHYDLATVMFTDFKGFTQITEQLTPEALIESLDQCFLAMDEIIERHGLEKIKTIGDSYMCAGGIPISNTSNPIDTVKAALEIQTFMAKWTEDQRRNGHPGWELRIGIHSGPLVAGVVGKKKFAYDIWGDTVNTASRMESSGQAGKINISGPTYELVKDHFPCTYRGKVNAKNKGDVDMYFVEILNEKAILNVE